MKRFAAVSLGTIAFACAGALSCIESQVHSKEVQPLDLPHQARSCGSVADRWPALTSQLRSRLS